MIIMVMMILMNAKSQILKEIRLAVLTGTSFICYGKKNCWKGSLVV
jgi:hypothetical protein